MSVFISSLHQLFSQLAREGWRPNADGRWRPASSHQTLPFKIACRTCRWQWGSSSSQWHSRVTVSRLATSWSSRRVNFCPWFLIVRFLWSIAPPSNSSLRYRRLNSPQAILPASISCNNFSLGPRFAIHTSYRDVGMPRPRNRVARIRKPSLRGSIGEKTDLVLITIRTAAAALGRDRLDVRY